MSHITADPDRSLHVTNTAPKRRLMAAGVLPPRHISRAYLERIQNRCETLRLNMRSSVSDSVALTYWTRHYGRARARYRIAFDRYEDQIRGWR